ncbi:MAG: Ig-like domain-containing protein [Gemmatimonadales bacterium]
MPIRQSVRLLALASLVALSSCGGGASAGPNPPAPPPPPPPAPPPVATVSVSPTSASLVPMATQLLTAETRDAAGNPLSGRAVTWSTDQATVATVSTDGLVTAVGPGSATITATSEGRTGSAAISVTDGGLVTQAGGTVTAADGAVTVEIPAGAVSGPLAVTVTPATSLPDLPEGINATVGARYVLGPEGTTFPSPVKVTVAWDPAMAPAWAIPTDFALYHHDGTDWVALPDLEIDSVAHTVTATTTSFSPFTVGTRLPAGALTPSIGMVNINHRSVVFTASIPNHPSTGLHFSWTTTGMNGTVSPLPGADAQYTMTQPMLPPGDLDAVQVIIRGNVDPTQPNVLVPLASAEALVNANLQYSFEVNPQFSGPDFAQTQTLSALVRAADGSVYTGTAGLPVKMVWDATSFHGSLDIADPNQQVTTTSGVYTAKTLLLSQPLPPRIDQVTVDFYIGYLKAYTSMHNVFGRMEERVDSTPARFDVQHGTSMVFVEVAPDAILASFTVRSIPTPGGACVTADAVVPKVAGATSYDLTVTGIVGWSLGTTFHKVFTGTTNTGSILDIYTAGAYYGVPMAGGCNTIPSAIQARKDLYQSQFGSASYIVKTMP